ncbi:CPBP family intramembrane metalloprotease [Verrucomicrobiales bacterium]|nr:CPBP family intramembrane metalloprotease [Verrucomicrobiales bacterium]
MDELAAKQVLLDFEIIILIATAMGLLFYHLKDKWFPRELIPTDHEFDRFDLILMWFPALLFLSYPALAVASVKMDLNGEVEAPEPSIFSVLFSLISFGIVWFFVYIIMEWIRNRRIVDWFGLRAMSLPKVVIATIIGGVISLVICALFIGHLSQNFLEGVFGPLDQQEAVQMVQSSNSVAYLILTIVTACIAAPLAEEFLFRGYIYGALKQKTGKLFAMVVVGGIFAAVHGNLPALVPLWAFSILLCISYEITKSLWVPIGIHAIFNATNIVMMLTPQAAE